ncbi:hypothetical protein HZB01_00580 [Candidatus Woesearchaeota archaeon]|nr:hypothetical protein [Candidatus Woesearchaeota archaeon]
MVRQDDILMVSGSGNLARRLSEDDKMRLSVALTATTHLGGTVCYPVTPFKDVLPYLNFFVSRYRPSR